MESKIVKSLNWYYYTMLVLTLLAGTISYYLIIKEIIQPINPMTTIGQVIQYFVILDAIITIPLGLYGFKRICDKLRTLENEEIKYKQYQKWAAWRIVLVSNAMIFAISAFYLLGAYQSMLWIAAISAIGWYFTKPTQGKMLQELRPKSENEETY
jgi:Zn-dependent membrane protease YugP